MSNDDLVDSLMCVGARFSMHTDPVVSKFIDFFSPIHTPINWQIPTRNAKFVTFNKRTYRVKNFSGEHYELEDFITGEEICPIDYLEVKRFDLRILTIVK